MQKSIDRKRNKGGKKERSYSDDSAMCGFVKQYLCICVYFSLQGQIHSVLNCVSVDIIAGL